MPYTYCNVRSLTVFTSRWRGTKCIVSSKTDFHFTTSEADIVRRTQSVITNYCVADTIDSNHVVDDTAINKFLTSTNDTETCSTLQAEARDYNKSLSNTCTSCDLVYHHTAILCHRFH